MASTNSLGLDLAEAPSEHAQAPEAEQTPDAATDAADAEAKKKEAPYVNPERVKTGGAPRVRVRRVGSQHSMY